MTVPFHGDDRFPFVAQFFIPDLHFIQIEIKGPFGTMEAHSAFRNGIAHGGCETDPDMIAVFGN